ERISFFLFVDFQGRRMESRLLRLIARHRHLEKPVRDEVTSVAFDEARLPFGRGLAVLRLVAAVAPILGLLGTILGIIDAFRDIAASDAPVTPSMIADGLWEALMTTAFGLMIALPCVIFVTLFTAWKNRIFDLTLIRLNAASLDYSLERGAARPETLPVPETRSTPRQVAP
ncbi:MotA/TolQ/ExbB proton channel family protein, partial [Brevundimonas denitrificans]|uniref:MotA/TolQ/ExbB proton channel family protein n=1 Tax=Brevundimonas denitrificans TaxID=1443434 RepID=UPI0024E1499C